MGIGHITAGGIWTIIVLYMNIEDIERIAAISLHLNCVGKPVHSHWNYLPGN